MKNVFWPLAFIGSLIFLFVAYYVTKPGLRTAVDAHAPWVQGCLGRFVRNSGETANAAPRPRPAAEPAVAPAPLPAVAPPTEVPTPPAPAPVVPAQPEAFDLKKLAANRPAWPARIAIIKAIDFPAVANGKVVGSVHAPAGTEVGLLTISGGKLGVEYQGGGAWLFVEETDIIARTQKKQN